MPHRVVLDRLLFGKGPGVKNVIRNMLPETGIMVARGSIVVQVSLRQGIAVPHRK